MAPRGYCILSTPLDLHASCDELIRNYELVRRNIDSIAPFMPQTAEIDIMAGGTSHSNGDIPLLGLFLPSGADSDSRIDDKLQDAIGGQEASPGSDLVFGVQVKRWLAFANWRFTWTAAGNCVPGWKRCRCR